MARNKWEFVAPMLERRYRPAAAALDGKMYVLGGEEGLDRHHDRNQVFYSKPVNGQINLQFTFEKAFYLIFLPSTNCRSFKFGKQYLKRCPTLFTNIQNMQL